jgi:hypothetical protein
MTEYICQHGIYWQLTGNTSWDNPDVQVKMAQARQAMDMYLSIQSHINVDLEPTYGRDVGASMYDVTPVFDDPRIGAGGDIDGNGFRWTYVTGYKFIHVDHWEEKPMHGAQEQWASRILPLRAALVAFAEVGENQYYEVGHIMYSEGWQDPYFVPTPWSIHPYRSPSLGDYRNLLFPATMQGVHSSANWNWLRRVASTKTHIEGGGDPKLAHMFDFDYRETFWQLTPVGDTYTANAPEWAIIDPSGEGYEDFVPIGKNIYDWSQWADGGPYKHSFTPGSCRPSGSGSNARRIHLQDCTYYGGWRFPDLICYIDEVTPIVPMIWGEHAMKSDQTFGVWPYCDFDPGTGYNFPGDPTRGGSQSEEQIFGYLHADEWMYAFQGQVGGIGNVPTDAIDAEGHHYWDCGLPPYQPEEGAGWWYYFMGPGPPCICPVEASYDWAVRVGTEVYHSGGHTYDMNFYSHWGRDMSVVVEGEYEIPEGHGIYYALSNRQRESYYLNEFYGKADPDIHPVGTLKNLWWLGMTQLYSRCPCYAHYNCEDNTGWCEGFEFCGPWWDERCDIGQYFTEIYGGEGADPLYHSVWGDSIGYHEYYLQVNGVPYLLHSNNCYSPHYAPYCYPRLYYYGDRYMYTGGWQIPDLRVPEATWYYSMIGWSGICYTLELPCPNAEQVGSSYRVRQMQPHPTVKGTDADGNEVTLFHGGYTRIIGVEQEQRHVLGEVYAELFGPQSVDVGTGVASVGGIVQE